jgi:Major Facilitator Superfamily
MRTQVGAGDSWIASSLHKHFVPRQRIGRQLAGISLFGAFGSGMYYTCSALYFTTVVGLSVGQVGTGLSISAVVGLVGAVPIGVLADRLRAGQVYIWLQIVRGLVFTAFCLISNFPQFVAGCAFAGLTEAALPPLQQSIVGMTVPDEDRVDTLAKVRATRNVGFGVGALAATAAIGQGSTTAFLVLVAGNAASYFAIAARLAYVGVGRVTALADRAKRVALRFAPDGWYTLTGLLSGVLSVHTTLLVVAMPLWFVQHTAMPKVFVGVLMAVNTILAALLQARFSRSSASVTGAVRAALCSGVALAGFGVACQLAREPAARDIAIALAFAAVVLLTFGGLWQSASGWSLSYELADPNHRTAYLSTFQLGQSLQAVAAPWIITSVIFRARAGWLLFGVAVIAAGALVRFATREHHPAEPAMADPSPPRRRDRDSAA